MRNNYIDFTPDNTVFTVLWTDNYTGPKQARIIPCTKEFHNYLCAQVFNIDPIRNDLDSADLYVSSDYFKTYEEAVKFVEKEI